MDLVWKLSSIYQALMSSAVSPVVVPTEFATAQTNLPSKGVFSRVFYDAVEPEFEGEALRIVQCRIKKDDKDILKHLRIHKDLEQNFYDMEDAFNRNSRDLLRDSVSRAREALLCYMGNLIIHERKRADLAFLEAPSCHTGHYFIGPRDSSYLREKEFNQDGTVNGLDDELSNLAHMLHDFRERTGDLPKVKLHEYDDSGEGFYQISLRARNEMAIELLKRAGMEGLEEI